MAILGINALISDRVEETLSSPPRCMVARTTLRTLRERAGYSSEMLDELIGKKGTGYISMVEDGTAKFPEPGNTEEAALRAVFALPPSESFFSVGLNLEGWIPGFSTPPDIEIDHAGDEVRVVVRSSNRGVVLLGTNGDPRFEECLAMVRNLVAKGFEPLWDNCFRMFHVPNRIVQTCTVEEGLVRSVRILPS